MQPAIRNPLKTRRCCNPPHPAIGLANMQNCSRRSELELRGPRNGFKTNPRSSRRVRSAQSFAQTPNPQSKAGIEGGRGCS
eukprot:5857558-Alexandrium_andersonii.AAC.1